MTPQTGEKFLTHELISFEQKKIQIPILAYLNKNERKQKKWTKKCERALNFQLTPGPFNSYWKFIERLHASRCKSTHSVASPIAVLEHVCICSAMTTHLAMYQPHSCWYLCSQTVSRSLLQASCYLSLHSVTWNFPHKEPHFVF